jgi:3-oxoacyl-[acyl-carrier-protein] synthase II
VRWSSRTWDHAVSRGARIYGELAGSASTADAHHITAPIPGGSGAAACMTLAMEDAAVTPDQIGHINAHGTSTPLNDRAESDAIAKVFGANLSPGDLHQGHHRARARGLRCHRGGGGHPQHPHHLIPPTSGYEQPDPEIHLDIVAGAARPVGAGPVLSNSFGFGGHNGCLVIARPRVRSRESGPTPQVWRAVGPPSPYRWMPMVEN